MTGAELHFADGRGSGVILHEYRHAEDVAQQIVDLDLAPGRVVAGLIGQMRDRSIAVRAKGLTPPADLDAPSRIATGGHLYGALCTSCHLGPGMEKTDLAKGLYPKAPQLAYGERGAPPLEAFAELSAETARDHQLHDRHGGIPGGERLLGILCGQRDLDLVALSAEEELAELRAMGIAVCQQDQRPRGWRRGGRVSSSRR